MEIKGKPRNGLIGATLGFFIGFAAVALFGPTANKLNDIMHLAPVAIGFLVAMPSLSGSLLRIPFAAWVDTTGGRKPFLILLVTSIIGMAGLTLLMFLKYPAGITPALLPLLFLLGLLCGSGIATFSVGITQVSYWFPRRAQGSALGTFAGIGNLAPGIFSFVLPVALAGLGIARSYLAWLIFLLIGTVLYFLLGRNAPYFQLKAQGCADEQARAEGSLDGFQNPQILEPAADDAGMLRGEAEHAAGVVDRCRPGVDVLVHADGSHQQMGLRVEILGLAGHGHGRHPLLTSLMDQTNIFG
jgi:NNP family nitrate/nitrite transporter-like MFS transporter